jgi:hypothetical protein
MGKKDNYKQKLTEHLNNYIRTGKYCTLIEFLNSNSNLPGPRANLELVESFAETVQHESTGNLEQMWALCEQLSQHNEKEAPANTSLEFSVLCGVRALGTFGISPDCFNKAMSELKNLANDGRWRIREGVAMAIQNLIDEQPKQTLSALDDWVGKDNWLIMRAVAAGVAEPRLLKNEANAKLALALHKKIFNSIFLSKEGRKETNFKTLRQGLGYSLSVVVQACPEEGFAYMNEIANNPDPDINWILKENLKKNRLSKNYPNDIQSLEKLLTKPKITSCFTDIIP